MFKYIDNSKLTREEVIDLIIEEQVKGNKTYSYEKQVRLMDKIPEDQAKAYYVQLGRYIKSKVAEQLEEV